ncbi:MAG: 50S ribosomal protein L3 N(5)-glutamine methyltransferase [Lautropia sp.]
MPMPMAMAGRPAPRDRTTVTRTPGARRREDADALARLSTPRDLVRFAVTRFAEAGIDYGHGTDNPVDEATWLVSAALSLPVDQHATFADASLLRREIAAVLRLIRRRCEDRVPLAYLLGEAWLCGFRFRCDSRALVPRSPIVEAMASGGLSAWFDEEREPASILDLCTGGGSIAIAAAHVYRDARIVASDLSFDALSLAAENVALHSLGERIALVQGDCFDTLEGERFDLILCNPPYVNADSMARLPPEYRAEPPAALAGGEDGMAMIERILRGAPAHLAADGLLVLEMGHEADAFERRFPDLRHEWVAVAAGERQIAAITAEALGTAGATIRG